MIDFDLIIKYFAGKADPEEAMLTEEWAAASEDNHALFQSLHQSWLEAGSEIYHSPDVQQEWEAFHKKIDLPTSLPAQPPRRMWLGRIAAAAAVAGVAFAGFYLFNSKNQNEPTLIAVAKDKIEEVRLSDGTRMTVEPKGELVYPVRFKSNIREVTLVGSGSFEVDHRPEQPFVVHLGDLHVKVIGTSFHIARADKELTVKVSSGKVAFYNNKKDTLYLSAGETGKYIWADRKFLLLDAAPRTGTFHFNATPFREVAAVLSAHFRKDIRLIDPSLNNCKLSAGFENQSLKDILGDITQTFNLSYKIEESHIDIIGTACK